MTDFVISSNGEPEIIPSPTSSADDFNFLVGDWVINNRKLKSRLVNNDEWLVFPATHNTIKILNGIGNTDNFITTFDGKPFEGRTLRLFNPQTKLWSIYWADSDQGVLNNPVTGSFEGNIGLFFGNDTCNGQAVIAKFKWDKTDEENPVWSQAFSPDNGKTWEWNWFMYFRRPGE